MTRRPYPLFLGFMAQALLNVLAPANAAAQAAEVPSYGTLQPNTFTVRVYHGEAVRPLSFQLPSGERTVDAPQPWVMEQGAQVCIEVVNAHRINYTYAVGVTIDTTTPPDQRLPDAVSAIGRAFGGSAQAAARSRTATAQGQRLALDMTWLKVFAESLSTLNREFTLAKSYATASDLPEDIGQADQAVEGRGFRWGKRKIASVASGEGYLGSPHLEQVLDRWESRARADAAKAAENAGLTASQRAPWDSVVTTTIDALASYGAAIRRDWLALQDAYAQTKEVWSGCTKVGPHRMAVTLSIRANIGSAKRVATSGVLTVNIDPLYNWKSVEMAPLAFAVYSPGAETLSLSNGIVERKDASFRTRAGAVLLTNIAAMGVRHEQSVGFMLGAGVLDASSSTSGKADLLVGPVYRLRDLLSIGLAFSLSEREKRKEQVTVGKPLPAGVTTIEDASESRWLPGVALAISLKGYKF